MMTENNSTLSQGFDSKIIEEEKSLLHSKEIKKTQGNKKLVANSCYALAKFYTKHKRYKDALTECESEASIYKDLGERRKWTTCIREIVELHMLIEEYDDALKFVNSLIDAKQFGSNREELEVLATLGRIYLLKAQTAFDEIDAENYLVEAENAFRESFSVIPQIECFRKERARLYLSLATVQKHAGHTDKALHCINKVKKVLNAEISPKSFFKSSSQIGESDPELMLEMKVLHECYIEEASMNWDNNDYKSATSCLDNALEVSRKLKDKVVICKTLSAKAEIMCKLSDYEKGKNELEKACKLEPLDEVVKKAIKSNLKVVTEMCNKLKQVETTVTDHQALKNSYDELGVRACYWRNYSDALRYYHKVLEHAQLAGDDDNTLSSIYTSLYLTYEKMERFDEALVYLKKYCDLKLIGPLQQPKKLKRMAELMFKSKKPYEDIKAVFSKILRIAKECMTEESQIAIYRKFMDYQKKMFELDELLLTTTQLKAIDYDSDACEDEHEELDSEYFLNQIRATDKLGHSMNYHIGEPQRKLQKITPLCDACTLDDKARVIELITKGASVNEKTADGVTPLQEASFYANTDIIKLLIRKGANINEANPKREGDTALLVAACGLRLDVVELLLENGADPTAELNNGRTALDIIKKNLGLKEHENEWYNKVVAKLTNELNKREGDYNNVDDTSHDTEMADDNLSANNDERSKTKTLKRKSDNNKGTKRTCEENNDTPNGNKKSKCNDDEERINENTGAEEATNEKTKPRKRVPWEKMKHNNKKGMKPGGGTPLHNACVSGHKTRIMERIARGADVNAKNDDDWTPLQVASGYGHKEVVRVLIESGAHINEKNSKCEGYTPLLNAATFFELAVVELLLENGADPTATLATGETALDLLKQSRYKRELTKHGKELYNYLVDTLTNELNKRDMELRLISNSATSDTNTQPSTSDIEREAIADNSEINTSLLEDSNNVVDSSHDTEMTDDNLSANNDKQSKTKTSKRKSVNNKGTKHTCEENNDTNTTDKNKKSKRDDDEERINENTGAEEDTDKNNSESVTCASNTTMSEPASQSAPDNKLKQIDDLLKHVPTSDLTKVFDNLKFLVDLYSKPAPPVSKAK